MRPRIGQVRLGRVEHLQQVPADRDRRQAGRRRLDLLQRRKEVAEQHHRAWRGRATRGRQAGIVVRAGPSAPRPAGPGPERPEIGRASGSIIVTRSPPRSSSDASASSSSPARSCFSTGAPRERQCIDAEASRHRQTVCAASHSVSRMNQPSGTGRPDFADCRQSMRAIGSPGDEAAELPEAVTLTDTPPAMHALRHGGRHPFRRHQQGRQAGAERLGPPCLRRGLRRCR